jgi:N-acetylglucosaminyldiphosphoundecaprenol N-acetyl-beta-D-mannosaminyltransferase
MLGVGAAFDFHAGRKPQAPAWMQLIGLEWLFRLLHEPRRLARRYFYNNPRFVLLALLELLGILNLDKQEE